MSNNGTYLENEVQKHLKKIKVSTFRFRRMQDSKAARNVITANPSDFFIANSDKCFHLECKSRDSTTERLEKFDQLAELKAWDQAGVTGLILVHFHKTDIFKLAPTAELEFGVPSWSLKGYETFKTFDAVMLKLMEAIGL